MEQKALEKQVITLTKKVDQLSRIVMALRQEMILLKKQARHLKASAHASTNIQSALSRQIHREP